MPARISVPGPTMLFVSTAYIPSTPPNNPINFLFLGISQDGVNVSFQNVAVEVPTDSAGTIIPHDYAYGGTQAFIDCTLRIVGHNIGDIEDSLFGPYLSSGRRYRVGFPIVHKRSYGLLVAPAYTKLPNAVFHEAVPIYFPRTYVRSADPITISASGMSLRVTWRALPLLFFDDRGLNAPLFDRNIPQQFIQQLIAQRVANEKDWQQGFYNSGPGGDDGDGDDDGGDGGYGGDNGGYSGGY